MYIFEHVTSRKSFVSRCEGGVAGEEKFGVPRFHSWGKCTMPSISTDIGCPTLPMARVVTYLY